MNTLHENNGAHQHGKLKTSRGSRQGPTAQKWPRPDPPRSGHRAREPRAGTSGTAGAMGVAGRERRLVCLSPSPTPRLLASSPSLLHSLDPVADLRARRCAMRLAGARAGSSVPKPVGLLPLLRPRRRSPGACTSPLHLAAGSPLGWRGGQGRGPG